MSFRDLKNQAGVSLVELMVGVGLLSILALTVASLSSQTSATLKQLEKKGEATEISTLVGLVTVDRDSCGIMVRRAIGPATIGAANFAPIDLPTLEQCSPATPGVCSTILSMANPNLSSGLVIRSIQLQPDPLGAPMTTMQARPPAWSSAPSGALNPPIAYNRIRARVAVTVENPNTQSSGYKGFRTISKTVDLLVNPTTGEPDLCVADQDSPEATCRDLLGGIYDPAASPACRVRSIALNDSGQWPQDLYAGAVPPASLFVGEKTAGGGQGNNLILYGDNPGFAFRGNAGASAAPAPVVDSGAGSMGYNSTSRNLTFRSGLNGQMVISAPGPASSITLNVGGVTGAQAAMRIERDRIVIFKNVVVEGGFVDRERVVPITTGPPPPLPTPGPGPAPMPSPTPGPPAGPLPSTLPF